MATMFKKDRRKIRIINWLLNAIEEGIRGEMCQSVHRCANANNKYIKNYNKSIEWSYLTYLDANNLYRWAIKK